MMKIKILLCLCLFFLPQVHAQEAAENHGKEGAYLGSIPSELPEWFKESFLDLVEDVEEAADEGKRVMIYFHQSGCPYCAKLVNDNFTDPEMKAYVQKNFDVIAINMWGDREIVSIGNKTYTEKEFALALQVQYTPTVLFFNEKGKIALRLNGYYPKESFQHALRYVADHKESTQNFNQYVEAQQAKGDANKSLNQEDFFLKNNNLTSLVKLNSKVNAVFFERPNCAACDDMHQLILTDEATRNIVKKTNAIQIDVTSDEMITTQTGQQLTAKEWANQLGVAYQPSVILFDEAGKEVIRIEAFIKTFHFQSVFAYAIEKAYLTEPSFQRYIAARGERIRAKGLDTDIWGYKSAFKLEDAK